MSLFPFHVSMASLEPRATKRAYFLRPQGSTALCPRCGIDAVIGSESGYPVTKRFLERMQAQWFESVLTDPVQRAALLDRECAGDDTPYYPIRLVKEKSLLALYVNRARLESRTSFVGRLGTYRYLDMHVAIAEALDVAERFLNHQQSGIPMPTFFVDPL